MGARLNEGGPRRGLGGAGCELSQSRVPRRLGGGGAEAPWKCVGDIEWGDRARARRARAHTRTLGPARSEIPGHVSNY